MFGRSCSKYAEWVFFSRIFTHFMLQEENVGWNIMELKGLYIHKQAKIFIKEMKPLML